MLFMYYNPFRCGTLGFISISMFLNLGIIKYTTNRHESCEFSIYDWLCYNITVCGADSTWMDYVDVPAEVNVTAVEGFICSTNFTVLLADIMDRFDINEIIAAIQSNGTNLSPDWSKVSNSKPTGILKAIVGREIIGIYLLLSCLFFTLKTALVFNIVLQ